MIRAIVFDCFGVLTSDRWKEFQATQPGDVVQLIRGVHWAFAKHEINYQEFRAQVAKLTGCSESELDDIFLVHSSRPKNQPLFLFIKELKKQYKIGLLSNVGSDWVKQEFLTTDEQQLFDSMVFSYETGYAKPNPEIFDYAAQQLQTKPQECVLVDDSDSNCRGAQEAGWQAILYENATQLKNDLQALISQK